MNSQDNNNIGNENENKGSQNKSPFDNPNEESDQPLDHEKITEGINEKRSKEVLIKSKNNIKFLKGNVHISQYIFKKMNDQKEHFKSVIDRHGEPSMNENNMPNIESLPDEQKRWFEEYKNAAAKLKKDMNNSNYNVLKAIGLENDIPSALCLIASMKPGVHEASQKLLTTEFGIPDNGGQIPLNEMNQDKHQEHKTAYEVVEKVIVDSIQRCTKVMELNVLENGFIEVAKFVDLMIPMYVPYKRVESYIQFNKELIQEKNWQLDEQQNKIKRAQELFNMH